HLGQPQLRESALEERHLLLHRVHQRNVQLRPRDRGGDAGEPSPAARVEEASRRQHGHHCQRVEDVLLRHLRGIGDRGQVDRLVPLHHQIHVSAELLELLGSEPHAHPGGSFLDLLQLRSFHAHSSSRPKCPKSRTRRRRSPALVPTISTRTRAVPSDEVQASSKDWRSRNDNCSSRTAPGPVDRATNSVPSTSATLAPPQSPLRPWLRIASSTSSACSARYSSTWTSVTPRSRRMPS